MKHTIHYICICEMVKEFPPNAVIAEIGCYEGEATVIFAEACKMVYAIDPWLKGYDDTDIVSNENLEYVYNKVFLPNISKFDNIHVIRKTSEVAAAQIPMSALDVVYIDAKHSYDAVKKDIEIWMPKLRPNGILCGHDYCKDWNEVVRAVDEAVGQPDRVYEDTTWLHRI